MEKKQNVAATYTLQYNGNGNSSGSVPVDGNSYAPGDKATVLGNTGNLANVNGGFGGWNTKSDGSGATYYEGDQIVITDAAVLYAIWLPYFYSINNNNTITIVAYTGSGENPVIPDTILKMPVTDIGTAFSYNYTIKSVTLPAYLTTVPASAFLSCVYLQSVTFRGTGLTSIGSDAFNWCRSLTSITIPSSVTSIDARAFRYCIKLASITIPSSVTSIGDDAFADCYALGSVKILGSGIAIGCEAFFHCDILTNATFLGYAPTSFGSDVFSYVGQGFAIRYYASKANGTVPWTTPTWNGYNTIPLNTVTYDGNGNTGGSAPDREDYESGSAVNVLDNTGKMTKNEYSFAGWNAKSDGSGITYVAGDTINITGDMTLYAIWIPFEFTVSFDKKYVSILSYLGRDGAVTIPETIMKLPVKVLENGAFYSNPLTSVTLPVNLTTISSSAFDSCINLTKVSFSGTNISSIGDSAFSGCISLTSITIPNGVTRIGEHTFYKCVSLKSLSIPTGVTSISSYLCYGCKQLVSVTLPAEINNIGDYAFSDCSLLSSVKIPGKVTVISSYTFSGCSALTDIVIPSGVAQIGDYAFYGCTSLPTLDLPSSLTNIGAGAFQDCKVFDGVLIPESVISIGDKAFFNATRFEKVQFRGYAPTSFGNAVFDGVSSTFVINYLASKANGTVPWTTPKWNGYPAYPVKI